MYPIILSNDKIGRTPPPIEPQFWAGTIGPILWFPIFLKSAYLKTPIHEAWCFLPEVNMLANFCHLSAPLWYKPIKSTVDMQRSNYRKSIEMICPCFNSITDTLDIFFPSPPHVGTEHVFKFMTIIDYNYSIKNKMVCKHTFILVVYMLSQVWYLIYSLRYKQPCSGSKCVVSKCWHMSVIPICLIRVELVENWLQIFICQMAALTNLRLFHE